MFPLGDLTKDAGAGRGGRRGFAVAASRTPTTSASSRTVTPAATWPRSSGAATGPVVDAETGEVLGEHDGYFGYTIGQRKGLRLARPAADGRPRYVLGIEPVTGTVTVGPADGLDVERDPARHSGMVHRLAHRFPAADSWSSCGHTAETVPAQADLGGRQAEPGAATGRSRGVAPGQTVGAVRPGGRATCWAPRPSCAHRLRWPTQLESPALACRRRSRDRHRLAAGHVGREAARMVAGELPELPHLVELPDRGAGADIDRPGGRPAGGHLPAEVVPSGWRISRRPGRDTRRAKDFLAVGLDAASAALRRGRVMSRSRSAGRGRSPRGWSCRPGTVR